ncbi:hypothetical protein [Stenotrophomonas sp.]|uniref:hypothetical protein n=1 Tax=Stenotrophomonas sp. TaxID=69392 RepID=UPI002D5D6EA2|nr:hypothetical protein [Stenotrophomonas sp.]HYQ24184.1 hypothetical protein [Stenotrophomonas sp.]
MFRCSVILAAALAVVPLAAAAAGPVPAPAAAPAAGRAFIEYSDITAPRQVGPWQMVNHSYDPDNKRAGAGFSYTHPDHAGVIASVYVYPAGRMTHDAALEHGMADFRSDLRAAVTAGVYSGLEERGSSAFNLALADGRAGSSRDDAALAAIAKRMDNGTLTGQKLQLRMDLASSQRRPGKLPMRSNGYLFYKQLYYFKVRVSGAETLMDEADFQALADAATRGLVPAIEVANVGACADLSIDLAEGQTPEQMAEAATRQLATQMRYNCRDAAWAPAENTEVVRIDYDAGDWASQ